MDYKEVGQQSYSSRCHFKESVTLSISTCVSTMHNRGLNIASSGHARGGAMRKIFLPILRLG